MKKTLLGLILAACLGLFNALPVFAYTRIPSGNVSNNTFTMTIEEADLCNPNVNLGYDVYLTTFNGDASGAGYVTTSLPWTFTQAYPDLDLEPYPAEIYAVNARGQTDNCLTQFEVSGSPLFTIAAPPAPPPAPPSVVDNAQTATEGLFVSFWDQLKGTALLIMGGMLLVGAIFWAWKRLYRRFVTDR